MKQFSPTSPIQGDLAKTWSKSTDGTRYTFQLHSGGKWSDGVPLTATDVAFTLNLLVRYPIVTGLLGSFIHGLQNASAVDATTLVVDFDRPIANALEGFVGLPILPAHVWSPHAVGKGTDLQTFQVTAGGVFGGPFKVVRYEQQQLLLTTTNPGWYGKKPKVKTLGLVTYQSDGGAIQALKEGQLDSVSASIGDIPIGFSQLSSSDYTVPYEPGLFYAYIAFNTNPTKPHHRELLDPRVRAALAHATDRAQMVSNVYFGHAQAAAAALPPALGQQWQNGDIEPESFDTALANSMLDRLGYTRGTNGVRVAHGTAMQYKVNIATTVPSYQQLFNVLARGWSEVGVQLTAVPLDSAAEFSAVTAPNGEYLESDLDIWYYISTFDPSPWLAIWTKSQIGNLSDTHYINSEYEKLFDEQLHETDDNKRAAIVKEMQAILFRDKPTIIFAYVNASGSVTNGWSKSLKLSSFNGFFPRTSCDWATNLRWRA